jgi:hypothetical protein
MTQHEQAVKFLADSSHRACAYNRERVEAPAPMGLFRPVLLRSVVRFARCDRRDEATYNTNNHGLE